MLVGKMTHKYTIIFDNGSFMLVDADGAFDAYSYGVHEIETNNLKKENGTKLKVALVIFGDVTDGMVVYGVGHV